jgi:hypothetical protein
VLGRHPEFVPFFSDLAKLVEGGAQGAKDLEAGGQAWRLGGVGVQGVGCRPVEAHQRAISTPTDKAVKSHEHPIVEAAVTIIEEAFSKVPWLETAGYHTPWNGSRIQHSAQPSDSFFQTSDCEEWCQLAEAGVTLE